MDNVVNTNSLKSLHGADLLSVYEAIFNSITDAVVFTDTKRRILHINKAAILLFGYAPEEVRGKTSELLYAKKADFELQGRKRYTPDHPPIPHLYENLYKRKDGSTFIGETIGNHVNDSNNELLGFIGVIRDITGTKLANEHAIRLGRIVEDSVNEVYLFDENDLHFIEVNRGARENLGYSMKELSALTPVYIKPEFNDEQFRNLLKPLREGTRNKLEFETIHQRKNGTTYPVEVHLQRVGFGANSVYMAIILDITHRKKAEQLQEQLTSIFDATPDFMAIASPQGRIRTLNAAARRMLGIAADEDITTFIITDFHPKQVTEQIINTAIPVAVREGVWRGETLLKTRDGKVIQTLQVILAHKAKDDVVDFFSIIARDITDLKTAQDDLKQHRDNLEELIGKRTAVLKEQAQIIDQVHDSVVSTNLNLEITSWNKGAENMLGFIRDDVMGKHISFIFSQNDFQILQNIVLNSLNEQGNHEIEVRLRHKEGKSFFSHLSLSMLYDESGIKKGIVLYAIDISERKHTEMLLQRRTTELAATNKELEGFSYSVSHDLRAPLRAINGFSQALLEDYMDKLDDTGKDYLDRLRNNSLRMGQLINDLLDLSRINREPLKRRHVDLSAIVNEAYLLLKERDQQRAVTICVTPDIQANGDEGLLRILINNLMDNAWKYTSHNPQAHIEFGINETPSETIYFLRDDGIGFDMKYASRLFVAFQRLHHREEFSGTGIGLATVQRIINRHGGRIWAEAEPDQGATFYFTLSA